MEHQIVLASASPRRARLLQQIGISFRVDPVAIDESVALGENAETYAGRLALAKAKRAQPADVPVLGADTSVVLNGQILGKPNDEADMLRMLKSLSGTTHRVITAVALCNNAMSEVQTANALVTFRSMSSAEIVNYIRTKEPYDKAGSYAIQGIAAVFVEKIIGQPSTVVGLPLHETELLLKKFNIDTWKDRQQRTFHQ